MIRSFDRKKAIVLMAISWIAATAWIYIALFLSFQNGEQTAEVSQGFTAWLLQKLPLLEQIFGDANGFHAFIRKAAHVFIFFVLGLLAEIAVLMSIRAISVNYMISTVVVLLACTLIALLSEVLKVNIVGRHLHWGEAMLNAASVLCGLGIVCFVRRMVLRRRDGLKD